jgi:chromosomal replication initiator protein
VEESVGRPDDQDVSDNPKRRARPDTPGNPQRNEQSTARGVPTEAAREPISRSDNGFDSNLNPQYTFENFIKGEGNQLARAAAVAISENPGGTSFNPFFLYGGVGLGKTHLIQALGNAILARTPSKRVKYISSDEFTVRFVESIQNDRANDFYNQYKIIDVLIIDDVQFFEGKERTQDLFFNIFNALHQSGKQIALSSDKAPKDLKGIKERLISRFNWGLAADIQPPDLETRLAILNRKAEEYGAEMSHEAIEYIAQHVTSNIRELEGCLIKLMASGSLNGGEISIQTAKRIVNEISSVRRPRISVDMITGVVCDYLDVDEKKIRDKTRKQEVVLARQISMYLAKRLTDSSLKNIGLHFGGRDHSTVIHAIQTVEREMNRDQEYRERVERLTERLHVVGS